MEQFEQNSDNVTKSANPFALERDLPRGKFRALTLINWNGFFARTFDLDALVTTLSGGNGAGKSTTMAGFVTALIPDLTLLHFRNTTEAGASGGSRDKGLHGKLRPGVCYAAIDALNSRQQRVLVGVRLQQIAGRDKKVDIKPFSVQGLSLDVDLTALFTQAVNDKQARVLNLQELKERCDEQDVQFKQYNSVTDYHSMMFELGLLPKRLRSASDRSKFYKLIEASLYGGISSAITRSLRDYLLPENLGVRKAFQDMEAALRENRMTLEAIKVTQSDRDLFKHLINESTAYVASDYMRNANERRTNVDIALNFRHNLFKAKADLLSAQQRVVDYAREAQELSEAQERLEIDHQSAVDQLNLVQNAVRHQDKINRYQEEVQTLREKLEEQQMVVETSREAVEEAQMQLEQSDNDVEAVRNQLADYQEALNAQQTKAVQFQQAQKAMERAQTVCGLPELSLKNLDQYSDEFEAQVEQLTESVLELEQRLSVASAGHNQFEKAFGLLSEIAGEVARANAYAQAKALLDAYPQQKAMAQSAVSIRARLNELENKLMVQQSARQMLAQFNQRSGLDLQDGQALDDYLTEQQDVLDELAANLAESGEARSSLREKREQLTALYAEQERKAPAWLTAQSALERVREQSGQAFDDSQDVMNFMQLQLEKERELTFERDQLQGQKTQLEQQISRLSQPDGSEDARLNVLAQRFDGVLLSELYDDVALDDAPYFSALYGPARHAIVVRDLDAVKKQLAELEDCPDDLYLIEGDPAAFDDNVFSAQELDAGVVVQVSEREVRYSKFPTVPLFGRAAREKRLEELQAELVEVNERHAQLAFDVQKCQRLHQHLSQFVGLHLALAFMPDPEAQMKALAAQRNDIEREINQLTASEQQIRNQLSEVKEQVRLLNKLAPHFDLLADDELTEQVEEYRAQLLEAEDDVQFVRQYGAQLEQLQPIASSLQSDPQQFERLQQDYDTTLAQQKRAQQCLYALSDVQQRKPHFAYADQLQSEGSTLNQQLRERLEQLQAQRQTLRDSLQQKQKAFGEYNQVSIALKSSLDARQSMLQELLSEMDKIGGRADAQTEQRALKRRDELHQQLAQNRQRHSYLEKQLALLEAEGENLTRTIRKVERDYRTQRSLVVGAKMSWCAVLRLSRNSDVEKRLNKRELAYMSADDLRSMSDKALGALRTAVADNEYLRDSLRQSEDPRKPENKVRFFIDVYQHLRERIRQDIIKTDDPIDAIEQMEVELSRLTEELTNRERKLAISSESVANIMRKTIQREQNRIRMLNQGLQNIAFGQVKSVRLVVNIRDTHAILLNALSGEQEEYQDLFNNQQITFSEALAKLYQRVNPHIDMGQRSAQTVGEELLDYRNYLELEVEVFRGADGWLRAESGALSTGEAIGTGMSILLMVVQSWEEESRRIRAKDILPCRLLFLDEAARLDARSISTLFELCERLDMQLLIAAPENISPEKGTTYKLTRKVANNHEYVHVVGLKGFGAREE